MIEKLDVLDKGFVRLENIMGRDMAVIRAARVSYGSSPSDEEKNKKLISYLLEHNHGTPFEHAVFTFHVKLPIFVIRQWIRHRMSSYNEASYRYKEAPEEFYIPEKWRVQDIKNKQGSEIGKLSHNVYTAILETQCEESMKYYHLMLDAGIGREMARMVLPVNLYTEFYWTVNARALMHFLGLRLESHAQLEIRRYAEALASIFLEQMPWTADAYFKTLSPEHYEFVRGARRI